MPQTKVHFVKFRKIKRQEVKKIALPNLVTVLHLLIHFRVKLKKCTKNMHWSPDASSRIDPFPRCRIAIEVKYE
jgi:hypothetical protein